jgi:hypothetical protein
MVNKWFIDKTMANPLNKAPNKGGERRNKERAPKFELKKHNP